MSSVLALDLGRKRVGVAISHGIVAESFGVLDLNEEKPEQFFESLKKIIFEQKIDKLIAGLPLNKDGGETEQSFWTREFAGRIERETERKIEFVEESFSSYSAKDELGKLPKKIAKRQSVDAGAAKIILEIYLEGQK